MADNLPPSCAVVTESENLNFLEPFGPVQACNGTAVPFFYLAAIVMKDFIGLLCLASVLPNN